MTRRLCALLSGICLLAQASAQTPTDVCALLPPGGDAGSTPLENYEYNAGIRGKCVSTYPSGQVSLMFYDTPEKARAQVEAQRSAVVGHVGSSSDPNPQAADYALGDGAVEISKAQTPAGNADSPVLYNITGSRGCATYFANAGGIFTNFIQPGGEADWETAKANARAWAAAMDQQLAAINTCPEGTLPPPPPPPPGELGVVLACNHQFADPGRVECHAEPSGARADASIQYAWQYDGAAQDATTADLLLTGVAPGDHSVQVIAQDVVNGIDAAPQSVGFTKRAADATSAASGSDSSRGPGPVILITLLTGIGVASVGLGLRGRPPKAPLTPLGAGPLGAPIPQRPPGRPEPTAAVATRPPSTQPPPPGRPEPSGPPLASSPAPTPAVVTPRTQRPNHAEGEIWLTVNQDAISVEGNGKGGVALKVQAWEMVNGAVVDASADVWPLRTPSNDHKIYWRELPGYCTFTVRGRHAGNLAWNGQLLIEGRSARGKVVRPVTVQVRIEPIRIEVKIRAWKNGFLDQESVSTLPMSCAQVRGRVTTRSAEDDVVDGRASAVDRVIAAANALVDRHASFAVNDAHCSASVRVDGGAWSTPAAVRSDRHGGYYFGLPRGLLNAYPADRDSYDLPVDLELASSPATLDALHWYRVARIDLEHEFDAVAADAAWQPVRAQLSSYPAEFLKQLREQPEDEHDLILSALQRLRASILFALKYRRDLRAQRQLLDISAEQSVGALFDVITDWIFPVLSLFGWLGGKAVQLGFGKYTLKLEGLPQLVAGVAEKYEKAKYGKPMAYLIRAAVWVVRRGQRLLYDAFIEAMRLAIAFAEMGGMSKEYLERLRFATPGGGLPLPELRVDNPLSDAFRLLGRAIQELIETLLRLVGLLMHVAMLTLASALKLLGRALHAVPWDLKITGIDLAIVEAMEVQLGKIADSMYERFGRQIDQTFYGGFGGSGLKEKNAAQVLMDEIAPIADFDVDCAAAVGHAHARSLERSVNTAWQQGIQRVSTQEREAMITIERVSIIIALFDYLAPVVKLCVKAVQAFLFIWASLGQTLLKLGGYLVENASTLIIFAANTGKPDVPATRANAVSVSEMLEKLVDLVELILLRAPVLARETKLLLWIRSTAAKRIRDLYQDAPP